MGKIIRNGIEYGDVSASCISYDNSGGDLVSNNVQNAIDEINDKKVDKETGKGLFSGSYNDLTNKPSLAAVATSGSYNDLSNKPSLSTVATSGSYNDLSNKPTIPTAVAVKGNAESSYRTGNVNLTPANIGALPSSGGTLSGDLNLQTSSNDCPDIVFKYGNGKEKMRIWTDDAYTSALGPNYRVYNTSGTNLYSGRLATVGQIPTNLNQLTNGPGYITGINKTMVVNALGYTPPTSDTNNAVTVTHSNSNAQYPICWEGHNDTTTYTTGIYKCTSLTVNPYNVYLYVKHTSDANNYTRIGPREVVFFWGSNNAGGIQRTGQQGMKFEASNESNYWVYLGVADSTWTMCPDKDNYIKLGSPNHRWNQIYSSSASINTSDRNEKKDIESLNDNSREFIMNLNPVSYKFINGDSGRTHYGLIAQDVEETMNKLNMTAFDFAGFCKDQKYETYEEEIVETREVEKEDGTTETVEEKRTEEKQRPIEGEYRYGLRYEEFIAPLIKTVQLQQKELEEKDKRINDLEDRLFKLEALLSN